MSHLGHQIRLNRLMGHRLNRLLDITVDHGIARGVLPGLEDISGAIARMVAARPDAITMHKGIAESCFTPYAGQIPLIIKCSSFSPFHPSYDTVITTVEEALRLGADAVAMGVIVGDPRQPEALTNLGAFVKEARLIGMPTVAHIYPRGSLIPESERASLEHVRYAARVAAEVGIDIIKTTYTGSAESFARVVEACPALVVAAGGVEAQDTKTFLQKTHEVIEAGGAGLACGRFVWGHPDPVSLVRALKHIIHQDGDVAGALEVLEAKEFS